jgi:predicted RNase H-like HicB family nuclease
MKQKFLVVYEHGKRNYGGFAPDVPGCISTGKTLTEMRRMMREALESHLEWMASDGDSLPEPKTTTFDFSPEDNPKGEVDHYVVEWLEINLPEARPSKQAMSA